MSKVVWNTRNILEPKIIHSHKNFLENQYSILPSYQGKYFRKSLRLYQIWGQKYYYRMRCRYNALYTYMEIISEVDISIEINFDKRRISSVTLWAWVSKWKLNNPSFSWRFAINFWSSIYSVYERKDNEKIL